MKDDLTPASDVDKAILIGDEYISQVRTFGALGYSADRICNLLGLRGSEKTALCIREMSATMLTVMDVPWVNTISMQNLPNELKQERLMLLPPWKPVKMNV